jgi:endo-1,4-beta-xylanase
MVLAACTPGNGQQGGEPTPEPTKAEEVKPENTPKPTATPKPTEIPFAVKDVFEKHGMKAGTCLSYQMTTNKKSQELILKNFNSITFENELKPDYILDQNASKKAGDIVVKFGNNTLSMLNWCKENNMAMRGHTIIWYSQTPNWIFYEDFDTSKALVSREVMLARMESYMKQVFELLEAKGYSEMFYAYDVVNEAWLDDGTMRPSNWRSTIGDDYLWYAFYYADKYAPEHIDLYYNDFNEQFKTEALYNFFQTLKDEDGNYLIDGIGFQAHLYTMDDMDLYFAHMDKMAELGLKLSLTELDVCLGKYQDIGYATDKNKKIQGQFYYDLITGIMERVQAGTVKMDALTFWGFADDLSWRQEYNPLLLDRKRNPKYAMGAALLLKEYSGFDEVTE